MNDESLYPLTTSTITVAIILFLCILFFVLIIVRYHSRYVKLQKDRIFAEITIQENERKRIATDLHDSLGPLLSAVKLNINSIEMQYPDDKEIIDKSGRYLDEIIGSMRQISYNLLPNTLERKGLAEAIKEFIGQINHKNNAVNIHFFVIKEFVVPKEKEIHVFRIIQEIVHNTIKHANARSLQIGLTAEDGNLLLLTKDDGKGFDINKEKLIKQGLGLKSLESRVEILNGILSLESIPDQGTNYFIKIPLS
ncbi:MAG: sensor histidine kinase [Chitinophagaceae bacterium]